MKQFGRDSRGYVFVEATLLLPFCLLMIVALFYVALFMCQKANLQANLENTLIYYKNVDSDTYVTAKSQMSYTTAGAEDSADGSSFEEPSIKFPYRFFLSANSRNIAEGNMESFFRSMCGHMFFQTESNVKFSAQEKNYVVYKVITASATQTVHSAVSFSAIGIPDTMTIAVSGKAVVSDGDEFIRDVDFVTDLMSDTALGQSVESGIAKVGEMYGTFKEKFGVK